jgi:hypothetical protein
MNPAGADVAITDTILLALATQPAAPARPRRPVRPVRPARPARPARPGLADRLPMDRRRPDPGRRDRRRLDPAALRRAGCPVSSYLRPNHEAGALMTRAHPPGRNSS